MNRPSKAGIEKGILHIAALTGKSMTGRRHKLHRSMQWARIAVAVCLASFSIRLAGAQTECSTEIPCADYRDCCSQDGYCGSTILYCSSGCQSGPCNTTVSPVCAGGLCNTFPATPAPSSGASSTEGRCGLGTGGTCASGYCCSQHGYCGSTSEYCGTGCQAGPCDTTVRILAASIETSSFRGRCGFGTGETCASGDCCSQEGYCGSTRDFCGTGCQDGPCDTTGVGAALATQLLATPTPALGAPVPACGEYCSVPTDDLSPSGGSKSNTAVAVGLGVAGGVSALVVLILVVLYVRRQKKRSTLQPQTLGGADESPKVNSWIYRYRNGIPGKLHSDEMKFSLDRLTATTNGFSEELGRGAFGVVYKGTLENGRGIAVKKLLDSERRFKDFEAEVKTLGSINHANLVALLGFCYEGNQPFLIYEYVKNGCLDMWIFRRDVSKRDFLLPWRTRMDIIRATAKGLAYLHEDLQVGQAIIHLDIKPENILLDENFVPKIADFGMAKLLGSKTTRQTMAWGGTIGYMAPEVYTGAASAEMDVYSFGVVLLEVLSGRRNVDRSLPKDQTYLPGWAVRKAMEGQELELIDPALDEVDEGEASRLVLTALLCMQRFPEDRPNMSGVLKMIQGTVMPPRPPPGLQSELEITGRLVLRARNVERGHLSHASDLIRFSSSGRPLNDSELISSIFSQRDGSSREEP